MQQHWQGIINGYREYLPGNPEATPITLYEGNTPLIPSRFVGPDLGIQLYFKWEGSNPTGSFKDRGMTLAVTEAHHEGARLLICASTGNTSAAAAAYGARAGIPVAVIVPRGQVAQGKLAQAQALGAHLFELDANFDHALDRVRDLTEKHPRMSLVNSTHPLRIPGQWSAAFEVCDVLDDAPDYLAIPVGNGGNITAYWEGFQHYQKVGGCASLPRMCGFQAAGAAPIILGHPIEDPQTAATAIRIGKPVNFHRARQAINQSGGYSAAVSEADIEQAYRLISHEGIFCEPASAASLAGIIHMRHTDHLPTGSVVVAVLTGNGLKDPEFAVRTGSGTIPLSDDPGQVEEALLSCLR